MRVSLIQFSAALDVEANLETTRPLAREACAGRAEQNGERLVVLPEAAMHDFGPPEMPLGPVAQSLDGPYVAGLAALATELGWALVEAGADTLVVPAAWVRGPLKENHWATLLRAQAIENTAYVLGAGQCGSRYVGTSMVVDPMGVVVAGAGPDKAVVSAEVERRVVSDARRHNPSLANCRTRPTP